MDVEKLIKDLRIACAGNQHNIMGVAATAITDLLARAEAAESEAEHWKMAHNQAAINFQQENKECNKALSKLEAAEARAEKADRERDEYFKHLQGFCFCCAHRTDGFDCKAKCYGHKRGSAWVYAGAAKEE